MKKVCEVCGESTQCEHCGTCALCTAEDQDRAKSKIAELTMENNKLVDCVIRWREKYQIANNNLAKSSILEKVV